MSSVDECINYLPESLQILLQSLFVGKDTRKKVSVMQATRPRVLMPPLQLGLALQMHHHFASRFLIDSLSEHGFCCSYNEVQKYERSCAVNNTTDVPGFSAGDHLQYMADNVDHNLRTIDGFNTPHGMGIICAITPARKVFRKIPRISVTNEDILAVGSIDIKHFSSPCSGMNSLVYKKLVEPMHCDPIGSGLDALWDISLHLQTPRPSWSGMMQTVYKGDHPGPASVIFLPMIDLDPGNMSCIYSTMSFICEHAKRYNMVPMITFDQPLWWKALSILESEPLDSDLRKIILRLGGFHTLMSFLGCIGHIMSGSGLQSVLEQVYASNFAIQILSGKAYDRVVRGHLLVASALNTIITETCLGIPHLSPQEDVEITASQTENSTENTPSKEEAESTNSGDLSEATTLFQDLMSGALEDLTSLPESINCLTDRIKSFKASLMEYRTARLWLQYLDMVDLMRLFIRSERTDDWASHLHVLHGMLPYLAAAGHSLYTKSIHIYLQRMTQLPDASQTLFNEGLHVVRRSNRFWADLSTDLVIEQGLMRSMKNEWRANQRAWYDGRTESGMVAVQTFMYRGECCDAAIHRCSVLY